MENCRLLKILITRNWRILFYRWLLDSGQAMKKGHLSQTGQWAWRSFWCLKRNWCTPSDDRGSYIADALCNGQSLEERASARSSIDGRSWAACTHVIGHKRVGHARNPTEVTQNNREMTPCFAQPHHFTARRGEGRRRAWSVQKVCDCCKRFVARVTWSTFSLTWPMEGPRRSTERPCTRLLASCSSTKLRGPLGWRLESQRRARAGTVLTSGAPWVPCSGLEGAGGSGGEMREPAMV